MWIHPFAMPSNEVPLMKLVNFVKMYEVTSLCLLDVWKPLSKGAPYTNDIQVVIIFAEKPIEVYVVTLSSTNTHYNFEHYTKCTKLKYFSTTARRRTCMGMLGKVWWTKWISVFLVFCLYSCTVDCQYLSHALPHIHVIGKSISGKSTYRVYY